MTTQHEFLAEADRYVFDFGQCSTSKGYAQVDTGQDASYFGTWANPFTFKIVCYCEGDLTVQTAATAAEFVQAMRDLKATNDKHGWGFKGIDPGWPVDDTNRIGAQFTAIGLGDLLH